MAISKSKRRYSVSLTPSVVDRFQSLARELGMPPSVMSAACEDALKEITNVFQVAKEKGTIDLNDIVRLMGQQLQLIADEEKEEKNVPEQKRRAVRNGKNA